MCSRAIGEKMVETQRKVLKIEVHGLLFKYNHTIRFEDDDSFVIVFGPNGVGKTKFLEIAEALSNFDWRQLQNVPFDDARISYFDGTYLEVQRNQIQKRLGERPSYSLNFLLKLRGVRKPIEWKIDPLKQLMFDDWITRQTPYVQISNRLWRDPSDGEEVSVEELEQRYLGRMQLLNMRGKSNPMPVEMEEFRNQVNTHLIETQRLRIENNESPNLRNTRNKSSKSETTIVEYAIVIKRVLQNVLTENSRLSQDLDRTFPYRMLNRDSLTRVNEGEIRSKYARQAEIRLRLNEIGLIELESENNLPQQDLDAFEISILNLHLRDVEQKLGTFDNVLKKINLFEKLVNARLIGKTLKINAAQGIVVYRDELNADPLSLDSLSSGEQHEIILMFDLLFNVAEGGLVLIDEPEISLHASWQLKFIDDVQEIARLSKFQFIVATHSPQIINSRWDHMQQFGPVEEL